MPKIKQPNYQPDSLGEYSIPHFKRNPGDNRVIWVIPWMILVFFSMEMACHFKVFRAFSITSNEIILVPYEI